MTLLTVTIGTLRDNLDPAHTRDDTELWSALGKLFRCRVLSNAFLANLLIL
jgi:hypothetical protein